VDQALAITEYRCPIHGFDRITDPANDRVVLSSIGGPAWFRTDRAPPLAKTCTVYPCTEVLTSTPLPREILDDDDALRARMRPTA
jgi:hypothetical protein